MKPVTRVLVLWPGNAWALGDIRLRLPLTDWSQLHGGELRCIPFNERKRSDIEWATVIIVQREASPVLLDNIRLWRSQGKAVIFDIDDLLIEVPSFLKTHSHYQTVAPFIKQALGDVNHVTTTTDRLLRELSAYTSNVSTTPNRSHHLGRSAFHGDDRNSPIRLLIAATDTVRLDFIYTALCKVLSLSDLRIEILAIGNTVDALKQAGISVKPTPILSYTEFLDFVSHLDDAIGLIPLDASRFSSCKSPIKFLDYAACGIPSICSDVPPYSDIITNGKNGLLVQNNSDTWAEAILSLAMSAEQRRKIASAAHLSAENTQSRIDTAAAWQFAIESALNHCATNPITPDPKLLSTFKLARRLLAFTASPSNYVRTARALRHKGWKHLYSRLKDV